MAKWTALSRTQHGESRYLPRHGYGFAAEQPVVPILLAELNKLLAQHALGFIKQEESYQPVALLGLDGRHNLYVHPDGRWLGGYVPAGLRGYPFTLAATEDGQQVLCVDQAHLQAPDEDGEPLFNDDGELSETVDRTLAFLQQCERNRQVTRAAARSLGDSGLIEPWPLQVGRGDDQAPLEVQGLYRINEKALNALEAEAFAALRAHGALPLAYAQLFSMGQLGQLTERARFHQQLQAQQAPREPVASFFGEDDDELTFDFGD
ncbi:SapC family protein [Modicisalibacter tunisiensis]|uniref:SapC family protein n=1 Tax=Modicisalibacter tunisiensis TaxID=390637 RepID=UPI000793D7B3|nr:SapC family protein [Modicisalibacter tunisiensis]KXS36124.1 MAG: SapC family protein [Halomonadaceae bacterium T82-2]MBZ9540453.1 SapC family protein [Modicisalibacter tunisiensis]